MLKRIDDGIAAGGLLTFEGQPVPFRDGDSVAASLLASGIGDFRSGAVDGRPRAPYCMMGICFECLVEIDGRQNQQSCLARAVSGMVVRRQQGKREIG